MRASEPRSPLARVENTELVTAHLGRWYPLDAAFLEEFTFSGHAGEESVLAMTLLFQRHGAGPEGWPSPASPFLRVRMRFGGVRGLLLRDVGAGPKQLLEFDIVDISDRQLEGLRFFVRDWESADLEFHCRTARVVSAEPAERLGPVEGPLFTTWNLRP